MTTQSIFQKIRVLSLASAHTLLDRAMGEMTPKVIDQYIRDLDTSISQVHDELVLKQDDANQTERAIATATARITKLESGIQALAPTNGAGPSADVLAKMKVLGTEAMNLKAALPNQQAKLAEYKQAFAEMNEVVGLMEAKKHEMEDKKSTIESEQSMASSKNRAASAIESAASATAAGAGIDNLAERSRRDGLVANGRFKRAAANIGSSTDPVKDAELSAYLASLTNKGVSAPAQ